MKNIALGQFYPSNSVLHRADPRIKIIIALLLIVTSFLCDSILSFGALLLTMAIITAISKIPVKIIFRAIRPLMIILVFTMLINLFWTQGEQKLFSFWIITVYAEGVRSAVFMLIRIFSLVMASTILITYTTTPIALTDAIESLLSPLKKIKVPVHDFAMMMTIAFRFIPTLVDETEKIMAAQKARGADFSSGSLMKRAKALIPILIPLFVSAFRRADDLAVAMECRCYRGGEGRTRLKALKCRGSDVVWLMVSIAVCAGIVLLNYVNLGISLF